MGTKLGISNELSNMLIKKEKSDEGVPYARHSIFRTAG